jgi:hypothetical protein
MNSFDGGEPGEVARVEGNDPRETIGRHRGYKPYVMDFRAPDLMLLNQPPHPERLSVSGKAVKMRSNWSTCWTTSAMVNP